MFGERERRPNFRFGVIPPVLLSPRPRALYSQFLWNDDVVHDAASFAFYNSIALERQWKLLTNADPLVIRISSTLEYLLPRSTDTRSTDGTMLTLDLRIRVKAPFLITAHQARCVAPLQRNARRVTGVCILDLSVVASFASRLVHNTRHLHTTKAMTTPRGARSSPPDDRDDDGNK